MNKFKQEYLRKVMKFQDKRVELTEQQRKFLEYAKEELVQRINYLSIQSLINRQFARAHDDYWGTLGRWNTKSCQVTNILTENSYSMNERTMLLKLRNYHLRKL
jgi:hypothetical protein